jgi:predicted  nucleic acid-binding Zn-ribbon protein
MPENKTDKIRQKIKELKRKIHQEKEGIQKIEDLIKKKVEREPGIWEYDFDELESEIWNKYENIEKKIQDLSEEISECSGRNPKSLYKFFKNLRGNIIRQNVINQEIISFYLATMLSLQKLKDRLNSLEFKAEKINREKEELTTEIEEYRAELEKKKEKTDE